MMGRARLASAIQARYSRRWLGGRASKMRAVAGCVWRVAVRFSGTGTGSLRGAAVGRTGSTSSRDSASSTAVAR